MAEVMRTPEVSVVMSVYNGAAGLVHTLDSVLTQDHDNFEFIVIDDGSTDGSGAILDARAQSDPRLVVLHQHNTGLTRALIVGCAKARGEFIARQDVDDASLPGRLSTQARVLRQNPDLASVASSVRFLAPEGEWISDRVISGLVEISLDFEQMRVPPLVAAMFRRSAYESVGGFQPEFRTAQDVDLWLRLDEVGPCLGLGEIHYESRLTAGGITSRRRSDQFVMAELAIECAKLRRSGHSDRPLLDRPLPEKAPKSATGAGRAEFLYFIGCCLRGHDPQAARRYFSQALKENPLHLRARLRSLAG
jgi:glycosyltransferase involved in cell wall biosynthesis